MLRLLAVLFFFANTLTAASAKEQDLADALQCLQMHVNGMALNSTQVKRVRRRRRVLRRRRTGTSGDDDQEEDDDGCTTEDDDDGSEAAGDEDDRLRGDDDGTDDDDASCDQATSFGDPHVRDIYGHQFDILRPGEHALFVVPRGAMREAALLHVGANVTGSSGECAALYITGLTLHGAWLGAIKSVRFATYGDRLGPSEAADLWLAGAGHISIADFNDLVPSKVGHLITHDNVTEPRGRQQHVTTMKVQLHLGPATFDIDWVHQKEKEGFSNSLSLQVSGLKQAGAVGGILGQDDHAWAASPRSGCPQRRMALKKKVFAVDAAVEF